MTRKAASDRSELPSQRAGYAKSRATRARILAAALAEASESSFHKASVARIAERAGVAIGSVSDHFGSRADLLGELMAARMGDLMARLPAAADDDSAGFFERERAALLAYLEHVRAHPELVPLADEMKLQDPDLYRRGLRRWVERMATKTCAGIEDGIRRPMDDVEIEAQAHLLLGAPHFLEQMTESDESLGDAAVVDTYLGLVRDGLVRRPEDAR
jgi:AcrR family transcriptional regulator